MQKIPHHGRTTSNHNVYKGLFNAQIQDISINQRIKEIGNY